MHRTACTSHRVAIAVNHMTRESHDTTVMTYVKASWAGAGLIRYRYEPVVIIIVTSVCSRISCISNMVLPLVSRHSSCITSRASLWNRRCRQLLYVMCKLSLCHHYKPQSIFWRSRDPSIKRDGFSTRNGNNSTTFIASLFSISK